MRFLIFVFACLLTCGNMCYAKEPAFDKAWGYYLSGNYNSAIDSCRAVSDDKILGEEGRYLMGLSFLALGDPEQARKNFTFAIDTYPRLNLRQELLLGIADSYFIEGKFNEAEDSYLKFLREFASTDYASIAYLRLGISQQKQGKWEDAEIAFKKIARDYPSSLEAEEAAKYLKRDISFFSVQVGAFSKKANADKLCGLLKRKGYDAWVDKLCQDDSVIYRVRSGRFTNKEAAKKEAAKLKKQGYQVRICS